jgi:Dolichyl-phosphate-mannose-protein mannosyltransferase
VNRLNRILPLALVCLFVLFLYSILPLASAFEIGDDEGFEVIKGLMCSKGYHLYTDMWNDQPPVFTMALDGAFTLFGSSILTARLVAGGFGLLLVSSLFGLVQIKSGTRAAVLASFFLLCSPGALLLMISAMLEVPAFALALLAMWLLCRSANTTRPVVWRIASGALMALALQTKFTAALVGPAMAAELLLQSRNTKSSLSRFFSAGLFWTIGFAVVFALIGLTWARGSLASSWQSHTTTHSVAGLEEASANPLNTSLFREHYELSSASVVCLVLFARRKTWNSIAVPGVLLATCLLVHSVHRPWWNYYYLHFAIALSWLAGALLENLISRIQAFQRPRSGSFGFLGNWRAAALCVLAALMIAKSERRLEGSVKMIRAKPKTADNPIVQNLKKYGRGVKWIYSESGIYPFHAGLRVIPELAIIMPKRFWSGQISTEQIISICDHQNTEIIILPSSSITFEWKRLLGTKYIQAASDGRSELYILNTTVSHARPGST